ncbi:OsmC family protein [Jiulongibacter sediminis]|uniref:Peroxiredoxin n=1 Tax=Jiulongibacter sediminis TaxID=1605367 RepID=A0A0P7C5A3_9BACT|nr:OsmC family protein [Jiulongibacter sediminis]KPM48446.1 peroxiredoxin [Jiulongibacter sediminis]TBX24984.1 peroxiredoxin [Jiulongibacter sediminis]
MKRSATAVWKGTGKDGSGTLGTQSGALKEVPYTFRMRFEDEPGTNPEELIAAAHVGCFNMKLSFVLQEAGLEATELNTTCKINMEDGTLTTSELSLDAVVPNVSDEDFGKMVDDAKENCPISKVLNLKTSVEYTLKNN